MDTGGGQRMGILYKETPARAVWTGKELARKRKHSVPLHSWPWKATRRGGLGADRALVLFLNFPCLSLVSAKGISMDPFPLGKKMSSLLQFHSPQRPRPLQRALFPSDASAHVGDDDRCTKTVIRHGSRPRLSSG